MVEKVLICTYVFVKQNIKWFALEQKTIQNVW